MLTRRRLLLGGAAGAAAAGVCLPRRSRAGTATARRLIIVFAKGGWDQTTVLEPRLGDPDIDGADFDEDPNLPGDVEALQSFQGITIGVNEHKRPAVTKFFENWGAHTAVVKGISTNAIGHDAATTRILTGTPDVNKPDFGAIIGKVWGDDLALGYLDLAGSAKPGPLAASCGRIGHRAQLVSLLNGGVGYRPIEGSTIAYPQFSRTEEDEEAVQAWLQQRAARFRASGTSLDDLHESIERASRLRARAGDILDRLEVGTRPSLGDSLKVGVDLLDADLCRVVLVDTGQDWDSHNGNLRQHNANDLLFGDLKDTMRDLDSRGMLEDTMIVVLSEMTRTPRINPRMGKDHWPHAMAVLMGAGVDGGRELGGFDDQLESQPVDYDTGQVGGSTLLKHDNFMAGLLEVFDIDAREWLPDAEPFRAFRA